MYVLQTMLSWENLTDTILRWWKWLVRADLMCVGVLLLSSKSLLFSMCSRKWRWYVFPLASFAGRF